MAITKIEIASIEAFGISGQVHLYFIAHFDDGAYQTLEMQTTYSADYLLVPFRDSPADPYDRNVEGLSTLFSGSDLTAQWTQMNGLADEVASLWQYDPGGPNSTSFVASILSMMGIDLKGAEPSDDLGDLGVDVLVGGNHANHLLGFDGDDVLYGGAGDDTLDGGNEAATATGADTLFGDSGSDISDATGNDVLFGRDGDDVLVGNGGNDWLDGGGDDDYLFGDDQLFPIAMAGNDTLIGGDGSDHLEGGAENDSLDGGAQNDHLNGGAGHDVLVGGDGDDEIHSGAGHDVLVGGSGADTLYGGADTLYGSGDDLEVDFLVGGEGGDKFHFGKRDIAVASDEGDSLYYGDLLLEGGQAAIAHDPDGVPSIAYYLGSEGELYLTGGTALYVVLPNSAGIVALLGEGGLQFGDETENTVEAQFEVNQDKVGALDTALSTLLTSWGWDFETGNFGPTAPAAAPNAGAWDAATNVIPLDPI